MNRTFFGDARDLFKFDLVCHIMKAFPDLLSFTFIPMLTEEESASKKKKTSTKDLGLAQKNGRAGTRNRELMEDMGRLQEIDDDLEYFRGVQSYFKKENIAVDVLHRDTFSHENRNASIKGLRQFSISPTSENGAGTRVWVQQDDVIRTKNEPAVYIQ